MIRGQKKPLESASKVNVDINTSIHNRFDIEVIDSRTGKVRQRAQAENIILDQLWRYLLTPSTYFNYIHYGSGTIAPSVSDVSLTEFIGSVLCTDNNTTYKTNYNEQWCSCRRKVRLDEITAAGSSISEIGIGASSDKSYLCTKALLKDMNGNFLTIHKTDTDIINIYATVFVHWSNAFDRSFLNLGNWLFFLRCILTGVSADYPTDVCFTNGGYFDHNNMIQDMNEIDIHSAFYCNRFNYNYDKQNRLIIMKLVRLGVDDCNLEGGIKRIQFLSIYDKTRGTNGKRVWYCPTFELTTGENSWYIGSNIQNEVIGTGDGDKCDFLTKFPINKNPNIKIDGSKAENVNIDINKPILNNDMGRYFRLSTEQTLYGGTDDAFYIKPYETSYSLDYYNGIIYENPYYTIGIKSFTPYQMLKVEVSDNLLDWTDILAYKDNIPAQYRKCKFWKLTGETQKYYTCSHIKNMIADYDSIYNIHFETPPKEGSIITADYFTDVIAKDENHVFDLTVTFHLGEKVS